MQDLSVLSDVEFEALCSDLMARELEVHVEHFPPGRDQGIDLRWKTANGTGIGQCKHYVRSSFSDLRKAALAEIPKVEKLSPQKYLFLTSQPLSASQKDLLFNYFSQWMTSTEDIYGANDVQSLLDKHKDVQREHPKLWLHSGTELFFMLHAGAHNRSRDLVERAQHDMKRFVATESFSSASELLVAERACVIAGPPGVGKTMLAHALVAEAAKSNYQIFEVSSNVHEAWELFDPNAKQLFLYDDFLGQISLREGLEKNEDVSIVRFMNKVRKSENHRFVLTTREYILREALSVFPAFEDIGDNRHYLLEIPNYSRAHRAQILYNHVWHSDLPSELRAQFAGGGWKKIVDHHGFSPRLVEYATGKILDGHKENYLDEFVTVLDRPTRLWERAYENQLREEQRALLQLLCSFDMASFEDLLAAMIAHSGDDLSITTGTVTKALKQLDQTFISVRRLGGSDYVEFHSPAVREFVLDLLRTDKQALLRLVESAQSIDQLLRLSRAGVSTRALNPVTKKFEVVRSDPLPLNSLRKEFSARLGKLVALSASDPEQALTKVASLSPSLLKDQAWWMSGLENLSRNWEDSLGRPERIIEILTSASFEVLPEDLRIRLVTSARKRIEEFDFTNAGEWTAAADFFEDVLGEQLSPIFEEYFLDYAESADFNSYSEGDFTEILEVASRVGNEVAQWRIAEHEAEMYGEPDFSDEREDSDYDLSGESVEVTTAELDSLFDRFAG